MTAAHLLGGGAAMAGVAAAAVQIRGWMVERRFLEQRMAALVPGGRIRSREDLLAVWSYLRETVAWDESLQTARRPLLRAAAGGTLQTGRGLCGENARAAVRLLRMGGCRANRLYLFGRRWGHVVVEVWWEGAWRLFDAHVDADTLPTPAQVGGLPTADPALFPNRRSDNPWVGAATGKLWRSVPGLARRRLPGPAVVVLESPHLMRAALASLVALAGLWLLSSA